MRLVVIGNIPVDLVVRVPELPRPGEDLRAESPVEARPGGAMHVVRSATRAGLSCCYAGGHGRGPYGDLVRAALGEIGAAVLQPPMADRDTGAVVVLVEPHGERTFVTGADAVVAFSEEMLDRVRASHEDLVFVSGYALGVDGGGLLASWVARIPSDVSVLCDLGPYGAGLDADRLGPVLGRVDWLACNAREAARLTGEPSAEAAVRVLAGRAPSAGVLVRAGADGCWLAEPGREPQLVASPSISAPVDTTGAGDTHTGAFLAAIAAGHHPTAAVALANTAAARFVSRETVGE